MKTIPFFLSLFVVVSCTAQNTPAAVSGAFEKAFPGVTVKKWDKEDENYEANFSKDGKSMSATFDASGKWMETETEIKVSDLPVTVTNYIKTNYKGSGIKEVAIIQTPTGKMYEAEVKGKDLLFDINGKFLKEEAD